MRACPDFFKAGFLNNSSLGFMLRKNTARIIKVKTSHEVMRICYGKRSRQVTQIAGCLMDFHVVTELTKQVHHARTKTYERLGIVCQ